MESRPRGVIPRGSGEDDGGTRDGANGVRKDVSAGSRAATREFRSLAGLAQNARTRTSRRLKNATEGASGPSFLPKQRLSTPP